MVRAFLTQLCLQAAAELTAAGASSVRWAFSYPTAFNDEQIEGFPGIWSQVTADGAAQSGLGLAGANLRQTESVATAIYRRQMTDSTLWAMTTHRAAASRGPSRIRSSGGTSAGSG